MTRKSTFRVLAIIVFFLTLLALPIFCKALPIVRANESYRTDFPKKNFYKKVKGAVPTWVEEQIVRDLGDMKIDREAIEKTYQRILATPQKTTTFHYRILDSKLYKYTPSGLPFCKTDVFMEKALKTLLIYAKLPDVDFLLCTLDGVPEPYVQRDFYITEDPKDQAPLFCVAKIEGTTSVILVPDHLTLSDSWTKVSKEIMTLNDEISWDEKRPFALWRGGLSDIGQVNGPFVPHFRSCPRFLLAKLSQRFPKLIDAGFSWVDDSMAELFHNEGVMRGDASKKEHLRYKYLPCLDGHMCTYPGYQWRLLSNSVCLKQESDQVQWFYHALKPYIHYIPIRNDMGDLVEKILWAEEHDEEVLKISEEAQQFARAYLLPEDAYYYLYLVLIAYADHQELDFAQIKEETATDPRWRCIQYRKRLSLLKSLEKRSPPSLNSLWRAFCAHSL